MGEFFRLINRHVAFGRQLGSDSNKPPEGCANLHCIQHPVKTPQSCGRAKRCSAPFNGGRFAGKRASLHNAQKSKLAEALFFLFSLSLSCGLALVKLLICPRWGLGAWVTLRAAFSGDLDAPLAPSPRGGWGRGGLRWGHGSHSGSPGWGGGAGLGPAGGHRRPPDAHPPPTRTSRVLGAGVKAPACPLAPISPVLCSP